MLGWARKVNYSVLPIISVRYLAAHSYEEEVPIINFVNDITKNINR